MSELRPLHLNRFAPLNKVKPDFGADGKSAVILDDDKVTVEQGRPVGLTCRSAPTRCRWAGTLVTWRNSPNDL